MGLEKPLSRRGFLLRTGEYLQQTKRFLRETALVGAGLVTGCASSSGEGALFVLEDLEERLGFDPFEGIEPVNGTWAEHYEFNGKYGDHAYATDFQHTLARVGLRGPDSTDFEGRDVDRLAETWVERRTHEKVKDAYGRYDLPVSTVAPNDSRRHNPSVKRLCIRDADTTAVGRSGVNTHSSCGYRDERPLGVFTNVLMDLYTQFKGVGLFQEPLEVGDELFWRDIHQGYVPLPHNGREWFMHALAEEIASLHAAVLMHEGIHQKGVAKHHTSGNMAPYIEVRSPSFILSQEHQEFLQDTLPGNRPFFSFN